MVADARVGTGSPVLATVAPSWVLALELSPRAGKQGPREGAGVTAIPKNPSPKSPHPAAAAWVMDEAAHTTKVISLG